MTRQIRGSLAVAALLVGMTGGAQAQLTFQLTDGAGLTALQSSHPALYTQVRGGFDAAAALWSDFFDDPITVRITIDYQALGAGIIGATSSTLFSGTYTAARNALINDATSANDVVATANLPASSLSFVLNRTSENGNSATPYFDNNASQNNTAVVATSANLKAMGFLVNPASDGNITFSSNFAFDFDRSDGIGGSQLDFIGVAAHEIGHAMGFVSAVDSIDNNPGQNPNANALYWPRPMDFFRFSRGALSGVDENPRRDLSVDDRDKYFSLNGGVTDIDGGVFDALFSNGANLTVDGNQASHWRDDSGLGLLDPTAAPGEMLAFRPGDIHLLDAIGWDIAPGVAVPEPGTGVQFLAALPLLWCHRRQKRGRISP